MPLSARGILAKLASWSLAAWAVDVHRHGEPARRAAALLTVSLTSMGLREAADTYTLPVVCSRLVDESSGCVVHMSAAHVAGV